jgi:hypothetical protein
MFILYPYIWKLPVRSANPAINGQFSGTLEASEQTQTDYAMICWYDEAFLKKSLYAGYFNVRKLNEENKLTMVSRMRHQTFCS